MTKIAVVTGASRGFGRGIAFVLATEANYKVYVTARNKVALTKLKEEVDFWNEFGERIQEIHGKNVLGHFWGNVFY